MQRGIATGIDRRGVADSTTTTAEVVGLDVTGMTCGHCAETVTNALESVDGVASAEVSVDPGRAEVTHDGSVARAVLVAAVAGAGYSVPGEAAAEGLAKRPFYFSDRLPFGLMTRLWPSGCTRRNE